MVQLTREVAAQPVPLRHFAYIFGSTASGRRHRHSDVDVAGFVEHRLAAAADDRSGRGGYLANLTGLAMDALESNDVGLVILDAAPPLLADRVARRGYLVFSRDEPLAVAPPDR